MFRKKEKTLEEIIKEKGYDPYLLAQIQPFGGLSTRDEKYIKLGDGYVECIHISSYVKNPTLHWLAQLTNISNSIVTVDIQTENISEVKKNINRSVKELNIRYNSASEVTEKADAQLKYQELVNLNSEISAMGETVKDITTRIFLAYRTKDELDKATAKKIKYLEVNDYKGSVYLNEGAAEWKSFYQSYTTQNNTQYKRLGQPVPSNTLAAGNPYHFDSLSDPNGSLFGYTTSTGGSVLFDLFFKSATRTHYSAALFGTLGSGKSTTLKKTIEDRAIRGDYIRGFDVSGEFVRLIEDTLGGYEIALDGTDGILNALEIISTDESESVSYSAHISKLKTDYMFLSPKAEQYETNIFEETINGLYQEFGFTPDDAECQLTGLPSTKYPTWSDYLKYLNRLIDEVKVPKNEIQKAVVEKKINAIDNIRVVISNLVKNFGKIVDGHTTINNITSEQIVFFNIKNLKDMKPEIFDLQIYNALFFCWGNAVQIGQKMFYDYESGKINWEDIIHTLIVFDEAHRTINANKLFAVQQILTMVREARKYFTSFLFASQNVRDFFPENSTNSGVEQIKTLFELLQYRFLMKQDSTELVQRIFGDVMTASEINSIPMFTIGETILNISGDRNLHFKVYITKEEEKAFTGGV